MSNVISFNQEPTTNFTPPPGNFSAPVKVWLVDDSRWLRSSLMDLLGKYEGIECTAQFHSPNAVLSALASKSGPDVILLDIHMGEASGLDAIRPIKALSRSTQVLMFTTFFDSESKKRALTNGASGFLLKQSPIEKILASIHEALRNPSPHLKFSRRENWVATRPPVADASREPHRPLLWLKNCLNKVRVRRN